MPKVTSKLQLTVPKTIADKYGIRPGDELQWIAAGEAIRVIPAGKNGYSGFVVGDDLGMRQSEDARS